MVLVVAEGKVGVASQLSLRPLIRLFLNNDRHTDPNPLFARPRYAARGFGGAGALGPVRFVRRAIVVTIEVGRPRVYRIGYQMIERRGRPVGFARARAPATGIEALDDLAQGHLFIHEPVIDRAHDLGLLFINHQIARDPLAFGDVTIAVRGFTTEVVASTDFLQPPAAKALLEQRAFVLRHRPLDLQEQLIVGIIREGMLQKDHFTAHAAELFEQQDLVGILAGEPVGTPNGYQGKGSLVSRITEAVEGWAVQTGPTPPLITIDVVRVHLMALLRDPGAEGTELTGDGLLAFLTPGGDAGIEGNMHKILLSGLRVNAQEGQSHREVAARAFLERQGVWGREGGGLSRPLCGRRALFLLEHAPRRVELP
jgi:hypothetical protein